jgi:hypothetical protein
MLKIPGMVHLVIDTVKLDERNPFNPAAMAGCWWRLTGALPNFSLVGVTSR